MFVQEDEQFVVVYIISPNEALRIIELFTLTELFM